MEQKAKKKILYIITKSVWGGAGKYVHDLATALPQTKFETMVAAGGRGIMAEKIISSNIPYFEIKSFQRDVNLFKDILAPFEILLLLFKTKPDIIHVSSAKAGGTAGVAIFSYKLLAIKHKILAIFTVHGWTFHEPRPKWQIWLIKFFSKLTGLFYDKIICVSAHDYRSAIENKISSPKKLLIIHNGIRLEDYDFLERTEKRFTVGTIGESVKNKGHKYLREAIEKNTGINLNIISDIPDAARYLKNFDIFVLPSLKEGLPYVLLEAGMAELPVIATNVGGIPEIIEDGKTGILINPADSQEIIMAVKKLMEDEDLRKTLAQNLRQKILQEFSFEEMLQKTLSAYVDNADAAKDS